MAMYPYSIASPFSLPSQFGLPSQIGLSSQAGLFSQTAQIPVSNKSIPKIEEFLQNLDNEYGDGKFTCFLESFLNESIDVLDVLELNDSDFIRIGISSIGIRKKLIRAAKSYTQ